MIFLTVGTLFSFDRLIKAVDDLVGEGVLEEEVFAQIGPDAYVPKNMASTVSLGKEEFDEKIRQASCLLSHAGMGSITMALSYSKPMLVMPRLKRYCEHVNDHQLGTARKFEELGHVLAAYDTDELPGKIKLLHDFIPKPRENQAHLVAERIRRFLEDVDAKTQGR